MCRLRGDLSFRPADITSYHGLLCCTLANTVVGFGGTWTWIVARNLPNLILVVHSSLCISALAGVKLVVLKRDVTLGALVVDAGEMLRVERLPSLMSAFDDADDDTKDGSQDCHQQHCHDGNGSRYDISVSR